MFKFNKKAEKQKNTEVELNEESLSSVSGGMGVSICGAPIYANCAKCGKSFKAGNAGTAYPLATVCPECASKSN